MVTKEEKYARKRILMDLGLKDYPSLPPRQTMKGPAYRIAHACFDCRKSFKIEVNFGEPTEEHKCPQCGSRLEYMGRSFRSPKTRDADQWKKVEKLIRAGFVFSSYRQFPDAEPMPDTLCEVDAFIDRNPKHPMRITGKN